VFNRKGSSYSRHNAEAGKQEELNFIKAISTMEFTPALLKELRKGMMSRQKREPVVSAKGHSTSPGGKSSASQWSSVQLMGKHKPMS
jgi:hypothetical protein